MKLLRFQLRPLAAWRTPWQADTLAGLLCWTAARLGEHDLLEDGITTPALRGEPPFVLSDAFPGDLLPIPAALRLRDWPEAQRKAVKRARWLPRDAFLRARQGQPVKPDELLPEADWVGARPNGKVGTAPRATAPFRMRERLRNTLDRATQGTPSRGGLWPSTEIWLDPGQPYLSVYARVRDDFTPHLLRLLRVLAASGFGADTSAGHGQFELSGEPEPADWLDQVSTSPPGCVTLSTFQPAPHDPATGFWEAFIKYGKLGPDFGLENVFKRPLLMLRPGACFATDTPRPFLGRAVPMDELLPPDAAEVLRAQNRQAVHFAFGLAVPFPRP